MIIKSKVPLSLVVEPLQLWPTLIKNFMLLEVMMAYLDFKTFGNLIFSIKLGEKSRLKVELFLKFEADTV
jgi:hypothetical protein